MENNNNSNRNTDNASESIAKSSESTRATAKQALETVNTTSNDKVSSSEHSGTASETSNDVMESAAKASTVKPKGVAVDTKAKNYKWQILEGLKAGQSYEEKPAKFCGYVMKRRRRPLKGWHKRYVVLEHGLLTYAKSPSGIAKGKFHGAVDLALSVISTKAASRRIDIDSDHILHLKVKTPESFDQWVANLKAHRLSRQHELMQGNVTVNANEASTPSKPTDKVLCDSNNQVSSSNELSFREPLRSSSSIVDATTPMPKMNDWEVSDSLNRTQEKLVKLGSLLRFIEYHEAHCPNPIVTDLEGFKYKKPHKRRFHLRKKSKPPADQQQPKLPQPASMLDMATMVKQDGLSHVFRNSEDNLITHNVSPESSSDLDPNRHLSKTQAMGEFVQLANEANNNFRNLLKLFQNEHRRLKQEEEELIKDRQRGRSFRSLHRQASSFDNNDSTIDESVSSSMMPPTRLCRHSMDDTSILSATEYYDAEDDSSDVVLPDDQSEYNSSSSSEVDEDESAFTDYSEDGNNNNNNQQAQQVNEDNQQQQQQLQPLTMTGRRSRLPNVQPAGDISLWNLLCKNIGKDLSKISMPVTINEPLNVLQRLCEELEYCELLETAAASTDPCRRMLYIAAFAVSNYSSAYYRAGHKPFNPLLGETYEFDRPDKGFRFVAEQVCHHPPVSACHAEANNYVFWQDMRVKSKFWGKSMEIIPFGVVHLYLKPFATHYRWNKVTTCVHNLFKGERYVDNYGELVITSEEQDGGKGLTCKITFEKSSYWSNKKNEFHGAIYNARGEVVEKIFGRWNESFHYGREAASARCIWRPGAMPEDHRLYYGFSRFAIELNELRPEDQQVLPPTDTRFRPDQRWLEVGDINQAEAVKLELEQNQRERRRLNEAKGLPEYVPLWFTKQASGKGGDDDVYGFNGHYWKARESHFAGFEFVPLW